MTLSKPDHELVQLLSAYEEPVLLLQPESDKYTRQIFYYLDTNNNALGKLFQTIQTKARSEYQINFKSTDVGRIEIFTNVWIRKTPPDSIK